MNCFFGETWTHGCIILNRDPVTPGDHMLGRMASMKRLLVVCEQRAPSNSIPLEKKLAGHCKSVRPLRPDSAYMIYRIINMHLYGCR